MIYDKETTNLSHMTIRGWKTKYSEILNEFGFKKKDDIKSAELLNSLLRRKFSLKNLEKLIQRQVVFVIGAGPSLTSSIAILKRYPNVTKIVADGATKALLKNNIQPHIVVTDLDGDLQSLKKVGKTKTIFVVHAHGDNVDKLELITEFKHCIGTTESNPFGKIYNFGGFTDGDRAVFLAHYFHAKKIILFGMDFGTKIGSYSKNIVLNKKIKLKKLRTGRKLLEWLATKNGSKLFTTSKSIKGFKKIQFQDVHSIVSDKNAF